MGWFAAIPLAVRLFAGQQLVTYGLRQYDKRKRPRDEERARARAEQRFERDKLTRRTPEERYNETRTRRDDRRAGNPRSQDE